MANPTTRTTVLGPAGITYKGWQIDGCWGLKSPFCAFSADALLYKITPGGLIEVLTAIRSEKSQDCPGMMLLSLGGFTDPKTDISVKDGVLREIVEESLELSFTFENRLGRQPMPIAVGGPAKFIWRWNAKTQRAENTGRQCQFTPVVTNYYVARVTGGVARDNNEVGHFRWISLEDLTSTTREYAFDAARVLEAFVIYIRAKQHSF